MIKKLLFLLVLLLTAATGAMAQTQPWTSGDCTVTLSDGVLTVSGNGAMKDNSPASQALIKSGKQTMTIDKNLKDMANNTAMIVNGLINNTPITGSQTVAGIPTIYSKITVITKDDF